MIQGYQLLAYELTFYGVMTVMVLLRLYVRVWCRGPIFRISTWRWSDIFICIALLMRTTIITMDCFLVSWDQYNLDQSVNTPPHEMVIRNRVNFFDLLIYLLCFAFVKAAVLYMFADFVSKSLLAVWVFISVIGIIVALHAFAFMVSMLSWCRPISSLWDEPIPRCYISSKVFLVWYTGHVATELMMIAVPFTILSLLRNLSFSKKFAAGAMFSLGFITIACAIADMVIFTLGFKSHGAPSVAVDTAFHICSITEAPTAICIACVPPLRVLFTSQGRRKLREDRWVKKGGSGGRGLELSGEATVLENGLPPRSRDGGKAVTLNGVSGLDEHGRRNETAESIVSGSSKHILDIE